MKERMPALAAKEERLNHDAPPSADKKLLSKEKGSHVGIARALLESSRLGDKASYQEIVRFLVPKKAFSCVELPEVVPTHSTRQYFIPQNAESACVNM